MTIEPSIAATVQATTPDLFPWAAYRACPVCKVKIGQSCVSLSGSVVNGRPDGVRTALVHAHAARKLRTRRAK
jgi:hypothetical protein